MFSRKNVGGEPQKCPKCGAEKVYFVQHAHGNYPILDYVCPNCDLGGEQGVPDWYSSPDGKASSESKDDSQKE
jgi:ssDNA-binding Zn-finger/Zn-ribbon topoisomerase 1